jgi:hypothetical protein
MQIDRVRRRQSLAPGSKRLSLEEPVATETFDC